jgi:hypothetical protein
MRDRFTWHRALAVMVTVVIGISLAVIGTSLAFWSPSAPLPPPVLLTGAPPAEVPRANFEIVAPPLIDLRETDDDHDLDDTSLEPRQKGEPASAPSTSRAPVTAPAPDWLGDDDDEDDDDDTGSWRHDRDDDRGDGDEHDDNRYEIDDDDECDDEPDDDD